MNNEIKKYITENFPKTIRYNKEDDGTLIGLPYKYTVPCASDMFQEMYYWDTYFMNVGLLVEGNVELAKNNVDNMLYLVEKFGFMPNGNRTFFLTRSQPPFLSQMVRELYDVTGDKEWLKSAYNTLKKEYTFWQEKKVLKNNLNSYTGYEIDPDKLEGLVQYGLSRIGYKPEVLTDEIKKTVFLATRSFCESGWDCNSRFLEKPHEFNSCELNSLLYGMEDNMRYFASVLLNNEEDIWQTRMEERKNKMQVLWVQGEGIFKDYNPYTEKYSDYASAATFYALFTGHATPEQAKLIVSALDRFELEYGVSAGEANPAWNGQWDYPNIWPPIQLITYKGLVKYGYYSDAERIARKYVNLIESNFEKTQNLWEKYNGHTGENTNEEYDAPKMLGWTLGVYTYFCNELKI